LQTVSELSLSNGKRGKITVNKLNITIWKEIFAEEGQSLQTQGKNTTHLTQKQESSGYNL
jgi:hypothetical protein